MFRRLSIIFCTLLAAVTFVNPARAYENEHYVWTYYLALQVGFNERQAYQIASGTIEIDFDVDTSPMDHGILDKGQIIYARADEKRFRWRWRGLHAFYSMDHYNRAKSLGQDPFEMQEPLRLVHQDRLWQLAIEQRNPGAFLHFLQDKEPHGGWGDMVGHGPGGHVPDYFKTNRKKAWKMTQDTLLWLSTFKAEMCRGRSVADFPHCGYHPVNEERIRKVLDLMIESTDIPVPVRGLKEPEELMDRIKERSYQVNYIWWPGAQVEDTVKILALLETDYARFGVPAGVYRNLIGSGAPDQSLDGYVKVVRQAIREDRESGVLSFIDPKTPNRQAFVDAVNRAAWSRFPSVWIDLDYDPDGRLHILPPAIYQVEEAKLVGGLDDAPEPEYKSLSGSGKDELFEITLKIPLKLTGRNDMSSFIRSGSGRSDFHTGLPVAVHSYAAGSDGPQGEDEAILFLRDTESVDNPPPGPSGAPNIKLADNGTAISIVIKRRRGVLEDGRLEWNLTLSPYGHRLQERTFALRVDPQDEEEEEDGDRDADTGDDTGRDTAGCDHSEASGSDCGDTPAGDTPAASSLDGVLQEMRTLEAQSLVLAEDAKATAASADALVPEIEQQLAELEVLVQSLSAPRGGTAAGGADVSGALARLGDEASRIAARLIEIRKEIEGHALGICQGYERLRSATDMAAAEFIHASLGPAQARVDGLAAEYRAARQRLDQLMAQAQSLRGGGSAPAALPGGAAAASPDAQVSALDGRIAILRNKHGALAGAVAQADGVVGRSREITANLRSLDTSTLSIEDQGKLTEIYGIGSRIPGNRSPIAGLRERIGALADGLAARLAAARSRAAAAAAAPASPNTPDPSAERLKSDIAFKNFSASYETAMLFASSIEEAQRSSHICNDAAQAMFDHRRELDQLARGDTPPPDSGPPGNEPPERVVPTSAPAPEVAMSEPGAGSGEEPMAWPSDEDVPLPAAAPPDPCNSEAVNNAFALADQAMVARNSQNWVSAINFISGQGCNNGRLQASIAAGSSVWGAPADGNEDRDRKRRKPRKPRKGPSFGEVLGGLVGVATAIQTARDGGASSGPTDLGTIFSGGNPPAGGAQVPQSTVPTVRQPTPSVPTAPQAPQGGNATAQNWCNSTVWEISRIETQALQASQAGDDQRAMALHRNAADKTIAACRRGCTNVDKGFCDGSHKHEGWE